MKAKLTANLDRFINIFDKSIKSLVVEINLKFTPEEMTMTALESTHSCVASVIIKKQAFEEYEVEKEYVFGVKVDLISSIIKKSKKSLMFESSDDAIIKLTSDTKAWTINTFMVEEKHYNVKIPDNATTLRFKVADMQSALDDIEIIDDEQFTMTFEELTSLILTSNSGTNSGKTEIKATITGEKFKNNYSNTLFRKTLNNFFKEVDVFISEDAPIFLKYDVDNIMTVLTVLANRVV